MEAQEDGGITLEQVHGLLVSLRDAVEALTTKVDALSAEAPGKLSLDYREAPAKETPAQDLMPTFDHRRWPRT